MSTQVANWLSEGTTTFIGPVDAVTAQQLETVQAWITAYGRGNVPVLVGPAPDPTDFEEGEEIYDEREVEFTHGGGPYLSGIPGDTARRATLRLGQGWRQVALDTVEIHPRHAEVAGLVELDDHQELDFPPPDCAFCEISLNHDGDGWTCEQCSARWDSAGHRCTRECVEPECDAAEAEVVGEDGQPRCKPCAFQILIGAIQPTAPYTCSNSWCSTKVVGMPYAAKARRHGHNPVCGGCQQKADSDDWWKSYLNDKVKPVTTTESL